MLPAGDEVEETVMKGLTKASAAAEADDERNEFLVPGAETTDCTDSGIGPTL